VRITVAVSEPIKYFTVKVTAYCPSEMYVCKEFSIVEVPPSPKFQDQEIGDPVIGDPVLWSMKDIANGFVEDGII